MARISYFGLLQELKALLEMDPSLPGVTVTLEAQGLGASEASPWVNLRLERRDAPEQYLAAGSRQRYLVRIIVTCAQYSLALEEASRLRDELMGAVELVLMQNRTISNLVTTSWLEGGVFETAALDAGFIANGEIVLIADVSATT